MTDHSLLLAKLTLSNLATYFGHDFAWTRAGPLGVYLSLQFKNMGSNGKIPSSIPGLYSTALELNDEKCAICYVELRQQPVVQTTCGHTFCRNCMMRYDFDEVTVSDNGLLIRIFKV